MHVYVHRSDGVHVLAPHNELVVGQSEPGETRPNDGLRYTNVDQRTERHVAGDTREGVEVKVWPAHERFINVAA